MSRSSKFQVNKGAAGIEFALGLLLFVLVFSVFVDHGRFVYQRENLTRIAFELARYAADIPPASMATQVDARFQELIDSGISVQNFFLDPSYSVTTTYDNVTDTILVSINASMSAVWGSQVFAYQVVALGPALTSVTPVPPGVGGALAPLATIFVNPPTLVGCDGSNGAAGSSCTVNTYDPIVDLPF